MQKVMIFLIFLVLGSIRTGAGILSVLIPKPRKSISSLPSASFLIQKHQNIKNIITIFIFLIRKPKKIKNIITFFIVFDPKTLKHQEYHYLFHSFWSENIEKSRISLPFSLFLIWKAQRSRAHHYLLHSFLIHKPGSSKKTRHSRIHILMVVLLFLFLCLVIYRERLGNI